MAWSPTPSIRHGTTQSSRADGPAAVSQFAGGSNRAAQAIVAGVVPWTPRRSGGPPNSVSPPPRDDADTPFERRPPAAPWGGPTPPDNAPTGVGAGDHATAAD